MWSSRAVRSGDVELTTYHAGQGPLVILSHGFPELAYSWRHQVQPLVDAGYQVVAVDQRGYGKSDRPTAVEDYDIIHLTDDLLAVLDDAGEDSAVFVGHDWGAMVVWQMALLHPERVNGVVGMSVPFMPRGPVPPVSLMRQMFAGAFFYIVYFQDPGVADAELGSDPARTMRRLLAAPLPGPGQSADISSMSAADGQGFVDRIPEPERLPDWLTQAELDHYIAEFSRTGYTGGLNWYRNLDRNWELTLHLADAKVTAPSLFIGGSMDPVLSMANPELVTSWLSDHRGNVLVEGAGHWVQQEKPAEVNEALITFLGSVYQREALK